jgi:nucleoside-diphosphate-sugar epimerase
MRALVTGATGFLGSHLVEGLLEAGHEVRALVRNPSKGQFLADGGAEIVLGDVTMPATLVSATQGVDVVFHSAALVSNWAPWSAYLETTVQGTENLLAAAERTGVKRIVHVSTTRVYDDRHCRRERNITEDAPHGQRGFRPMGAYAHAKVLAEAVVRRFASRVPISIVRPAWIYGPRDELIVPSLLRFLRKPGARWPGRVDPCSDAIHVTDVADCAITAALHPRAVGQAYNASPHRRLSVREFLGAFADELDIKMPTRSAPAFLARWCAHLSEGWASLCGSRTPPMINRAGVAILTEDVRYDSAKAEREIGWRSQVELADGVAHTVRWLRERFPEFASPVAEVLANQTDEDRLVTSDG